MGANIADWIEHWDNFNVDLYIRVLTVKQQNQQDMAIDNEIFAQYRENERQELIDRLEFHEPGSDTEHEIWIDRRTMTKYIVKVEINRDFDNMEEA